MLLIGHLYTVFEKNSPVQLGDRKGDTVRGQGVLDMKGGDVIVVEALRALQSVGALDNTTSHIFFPAMRNAWVSQSMSPASI